MENTKVFFYKYVLLNELREIAHKKEKSNIHL